MSFASATEVLAAYEERINRHDFDLLVDLIAPDARFWFSDGTHEGIASIRAAFERTWAIAVGETYWLDNRQWIALGDAAAACTYRFNWRATIDGRPASGVGRGTTVLARRDGGWQIVHEHLSKEPG
jgi:ketosteroid isomerase-like protein